MKKIKNICTSLLLAYIVTLLSVANVSAEALKEPEIKDLLDNGTDIWQVIDRITGEQGTISCDIKVRPGTDLPKLKETHRIDFTSVKDVYNVVAPPEDFKAYSELECFESMSYHFYSSSVDTSSQPQLGSPQYYRNKLDKGLYNDKMYIMIIPEESTDINDLLVPGSARFYPKNSGYDIRKAIFINPTEEEVYKYLDIIEEHPDLIEYYIISFNEYRGLVPDGQRVDIKGDNAIDGKIDVTDLTDDLSWLPYTEEDYEKFTAEYTTVACVNGYIVLAEDPAWDGGYSIIESKEGDAEYELVKQYNVRSLPEDVCGGSSLPVKVYKPAKVGKMIITWTKMRDWEGPESAIWQKVGYYIVGRNEDAEFTVSEVSEDEYAVTDPIDYTIGGVFTLPDDDYAKGDINPDGIVDITDLTELSLALLGDRNLSENQKKAADVDGDGAVTIADLARLQQYLSKKITSF